MTKVIGMLVALAMFCAMPAVAFAQDSDDDTVSSGNTQTGTQTATGVGGDANGGDAAGGAGGEDGDGGDAAGGDGGQGGDVGIQQGLCQQNAGGDADCEINQSQSFGGDSSIGGGGGDGDGDGDGDSDGDDVSGSDDDDDSVTHGGGVGGSSVESVTLARTGFDAWVLALIGGVSLAGGLGLLAAQRRGRLNA